MPNKPTRDQLARFLPTLQLIKAFESLFDLTDDDGADVAALQQAILTLAGRVTGTEADISSAEVNDAVESAGRLALAASLTELAKSVDGLAMMPPKAPFVREPWRIVLASSDADAFAYDWIECDCTGAAITVTLPDAEENTGRSIGVAKSDAGANGVTVSGAINGAASIPLAAQYDAVTLISVGSEWRIA